VVPLAQAEKLSRALDARLTLIKNGGHLNGSGGWYALPECLEELLRLMGQTE
jgi:predicted alpha/beta hydrolase family esterase